MWDEGLLGMAEIPPRTQYARSGGVRLAYQVLGEGPVDLVFCQGFVSNVDYWWDMPIAARLLTRLASFSRLIIWDKRGRGCPTLWIVCRP
jgi:hypothetical protein